MGERVGGILESGSISVGDHAPDFELPALIDGVRKNFRLSNYRGKWVMLAFYPFNWEPVSSQQMKRYQAARARVTASGGEIVAVSVESIMNTTAWERRNGPFDFPLCSDFWPHGAVSALYGVLSESGAEAGASERTVFLIDPAGLIAFRKNYEVVPPLEDVISRLVTGGAR